MLEDRVVPLLDELGLRSTVHFQQDGAPPHYALMVRQYLTEIFGDKWIGRGGLFEWPPRSPDLNPLDFFLWGLLKRIVYNSKPRTINQLKAAIVEHFRSISEDTLYKVSSDCLKRMLLCKQNNGGHFQHCKKS